MIPWNWFAEADAVAKIEGRAVLDTNVVLKMFFQEDDSHRADLILSRLEAGDLQIVIPSFMTLEFVNVLWLRVREDRSTRDECETVLTDFLSSQPRCR